MSRNPAGKETPARIALRPVEEGDLPLFFEHQIDPEATHMADFPAREWKAFITHWTKILAQDTILTRTILYDDQVAGNIVSFEDEGHREVGYWIGKGFWGKGIASSALSQFLKVDLNRPLYAFVARRNLGSQRVLIKCGFTQLEEQDDSFLFVYA